jgi:hypothetical protein
MRGRLHPRLQTLAGTALFLALSGVSNAQQATPQSAASQAQITKADAPSAPHLIPFSADETRETTQTLADGTQITYTALTKIFRDSEGRTRTERAASTPA